MPRSEAGRRGLEGRPSVLSIIYICSSFVTLWESFEGIRESPSVATPGLLLLLFRGLASLV